MVNKGSSSSRWLPLTAVNTGLDWRLDCTCLHVLRQGDGSATHLQVPLAVVVSLTLRQQQVRWITRFTMILVSMCCIRDWDSVDAVWLGLCSP